MPLFRIFDRNTILLLRIPFSFFLLPIFVFGLSQAGPINLLNVIILFVVLHFFIYPGSNGYNSYMDKDKGSIGGLRNPPTVTRNLYYVSMLMDICGLMLSLFIGCQMFVLILLYILVSKAYSWHGIRLKKYSVLSWLVVVTFQGAYTFLMVNMAAENNFSPSWFTLKNACSMAIATLLIGGFYPLTQIYQHEEDKMRGDITMSNRLGIMGTFIFAAVLFLMASGIGLYYFPTYYSLDQLWIFNACLLPVTLYFLYWFYLTFRDRKNADFSHAMRMTFFSSVSMMMGYTVLLFINHR